MPSSMLTLPGLDDAAESFQPASRPQVFPDDSPRVRPTDPITSHEAADSNDPAASRRFVMLTLIERGPLAQFQLEDAAKDVWSPSRVRTAVAELAERGLVEPTGEFVKTPRGRRAQVWGVTS